MKRCFFEFLVLPDAIEEQLLIYYTAAHHQRADKMLWNQSWGVLRSSIFIAK